MAEPRISVERIGREGQPLVAVEDFSPYPDSLRAAAVAAAFGPAGHHYPGLRAPLPDSYMRDALPVVRSALAQAYDHSGGVDLVDASFSIVTTPQSALTIRQRLPHCDAFTAERVALIHYLSPDDGDGTAFYRHRSTGFETVDEVRAPIFFGQLDAELRHGGAPPAGYIAGDTRLFERTVAAPARYNRALLYRSFLLHSGAISPGASLSPDPRTGRLTITAFFTLS